MFLVLCLGAMEVRAKGTRREVERMMFGSGEMVFHTGTRIGAPPMKINSLRRKQS